VTPRFSLFIPVWNGANWISGAIDSVLAQTYPEWELVIGDNASVDDLATVVARYSDPRIRLHRWTTHTDLCENFNRTMLLARYEWVQPLGVDDRLAPNCMATMAARIEDAATQAPRLSVVLAVARRVNAHGQTADGAYYGYRGPAIIPDGRHDAASWLRHSLTGVTPWNIGTAAFSRDVLAEMGGLLRPEIDLCAEIDLVLRAATYGDVLYIDTPLMDFTVRGDSDSHDRGFSKRAWNRPLSPLGVALVSALRTHLERREVSKEERAAVYRVVAQTQIQRAFQHRYRTGGHGRRGALLDVMRAIRLSPSTVFTPKTFAYALAAILSPHAMIRRARAVMLRRAYHADSAPGPHSGRESPRAVTEDANGGHGSRAGDTSQPSRRWHSVLASVSSWFSFH
jgi:glycosyltransferase involved in cell wall biosynthesis